MLDNAGKEAVGSVVLMRYGVNPLEVIKLGKLWAARSGGAGDEIG